MDSKTPSPVSLNLSIKSGMYKYWAEEFEDQLETLWGNMRSYTKPGEDLSEEANKWENRKEVYDSYRKDIKKMWEPLSTEYYRNQRQEENFFSYGSAYRALCREFFSKRLFVKIGRQPIPFNWSRRLQEHLESDEGELAELDDLREDNFLKDLWEEYGLEALRKERFPPRPKIESKN